MGVLARGRSAGTTDAEEGIAIAIPESLYCEIAKLKPTRHLKAPPCAKFKQSLRLRNCCNAQWNSSTEALNRASAETRAPVLSAIEIPRLVGAGFAQSAARRTCCAGHRKQDALHLRRELPANRFPLRKAEGPIEERTKIAGYYKLIQVLELGSCRLVHVVHGDTETHKRIETQSGDNLQLAVTPADRKQLAAAGQKQEKQDSQDRYGLLQLLQQEARSPNMGKAGDGRERPDCSAD